MKTIGTVGLKLGRAQPPHTPISQHQMQENRRLKHRRDEFFFLPDPISLMTDAYAQLDSM